jgi:hypothetical protein
MLLLAGIWGAGPALAQPADKFFRDEVAPLLSNHCLECHSGAKPEGGLDLTTRENILKGGETGPAIGDNRDKSLLWQRVVENEMPPKKQLSDAQKTVLSKWLDGGGTWAGGAIERFAYSSEQRAGYDWWSLQALPANQPPPADKSGWTIRNPIDQFVLAKLKEKSLMPSKEASPTALIRRVYFNLIGLPPPPEIVERFRRSPTDEAYAEIVDELLKSPRYGERWGRHWLDVARFGETDGFERNGVRENMWHYRDWVIAALNADMPYREFAERQLMGDLMPDSPNVTTDKRLNTIAATGFYVAGVHNTVVGGSLRMKRLARQDELEEIVGAVGQTFLGLTVNCARCHDHKFDPISAREYYGMIAAIDGVQHGEREIAIPEVAQQLTQRVAELAKLEGELQPLEANARKMALARQSKLAPDEFKDVPHPISGWDFEADLRDRVGQLHGTARDGARIEGGALILDGKSWVETAPLTTNVAAKTLEAWVQLDDLNQAGGSALTIESTSGVVFDAIVFGEREPQRWMAGSNGFVRTQSFSGIAESEAVKKPVHMAIVYQADGTIECYRNGDVYGQSYKTGAATFVAGESQVLFGLRHKPAGGAKHLKGRIFQANLYDKPLTKTQIEASAKRSGYYVSEEQLVAELTPEKRTRRQALLKKVKELQAIVGALRSQQKFKVYSVVPRNPGEMRIHIRGDVTDFGDVTPPAGVAAIQGVESDFGLPANADDASRRRALAKWITSEDNSLFHRTIVNRVWHYHFGTGIVETPNDLGFNGGRPSHPELLDWLALYLRENDYRLKTLHRLIVTSTTYRQDSAPNDEAALVDADNRYLWRHAPRRMEAEVVRDSMLDVAGILNLREGGPGYRDVKIVGNNGTTYYGPFDSDGEEFQRRTIYRFAARGGRSSLLDTFDCPDPSSAAPRRSVTTTPLQALSLLNSPFAFRVSANLAERVRKEAGDDLARQADLAWNLVLSRAPSKEEQAWSVDLVDKHGLATLSRALYNCNEFIVIE